MVPNAANDRARDRGENPHLHPTFPVRRYAAAGGVIVNPARDQVLLLLRPERLVHQGDAEVRLPKGHVEPGESFAQAAEREVEEETGLSGLALLADLGHQRVEFDWQGYHYLRDEHYYLFGTSTSTRASRPERQFDPLWLGWKQALSLITFDGEREWLQRAMTALDLPAKE